MSNSRRARARATRSILTTLAVAGATTAGVSAALATTPAAGAATDPVVAQAKAVVAAATARNVPWTGPTSGPKAQKGKSIIVVASDLTNTGVLTVSKAIQQAAKAIGWKVQVLNGQGTTSGLQSALNTAIAAKPSGIVDDGADMTTIASLLKEAVGAGEKVVAWNGGPTPGPAPADSVFYNVAVNAKQISQIAADYAIATSNGKANVVIFTDNEFAVAQAKANDMRAVVNTCKGCKVLAYENTPIADVTTRVPPLTTALRAKYGSKWTYSLAINDNYYQAMASALASSGISPANAPVNISAGDGSPDAFQRIRTGHFQAATVAAPLDLQGWQVVDEMNRAFAGARPDNFVAAPRLVTKADIAYDGGPQDTYIPNNHYQQRYMKIWGVK
jgi:ribose transport system substrate-binding protein